MRYYSQLFVLLIMLIATAFSEPDTMPRILFFSSDLADVTPDEAESGIKEFTLSWEIIGVDETQTVEIQTLVLGEWVNILPDVTLPASGERVHTVPHTLSFEAPTLRLLVLDNQDRILDSEELIIPYIEDSEPASIEVFTTEVEELSALNLNQGATYVPVNWEIIHRPPNSNLVFEQMMADSQAVNVELTRDFLWIRSSGTGMIRPRYQAGQDEVVLRLSLIDIDGETVYDDSLIVLPVRDDIPPIPPLVEQPEIVFFSSNIQAAQRGETITLSWATDNASAVWLEYWKAGSSPIQSGGCFNVDASFRDLPLSGSLNITMPQNYTGDGIRFNLVIDEYGCQSRGPSKVVDVILLPHDND